MGSVPHHLLVRCRARWPTILDVVRRRLGPMTAKTTVVVLGLAVAREILHATGISYMANPHIAKADDGAESARVLGEWWTIAGRSGSSELTPELEGF